MLKRLLRSLTIAIGVCLALVLVKNEYSRFLLSDANYGIQALISRSERMKDEGNGASWDLYLGSSMFRQGLDINELEKNTEGERQTYILSYNGAQPFLIYYELQYLLAKGVPIHSVSIDMFANAMLEDPWVEDTRLFLDTGLPFKLKLWSAMYSEGGADAADFWEMMVTSNNEKLLAWFVDYPVVNDSFYNGGNLVQNTGASREQLDRYRGAVGRKETIFSMNDYQKDYLKKIIQLCRDNGIEVTFIETPKYSTANREQAYTDIMHAYCQLLREYGIEYYLTESTVVSLKNYSGENDSMNADHVIPFDVENPSLFIDNIHLSSEGRTVFTRALTEVMKRTR